MATLTFNTWPTMTNKLWLKYNWFTMNMKWISDWPPFPFSFFKLSDHFYFWLLWRGKQICKHELGPNFCSWTILRNLTRHCFNPLAPTLSYLPCCTTLWAKKAPSGAITFCILDLAWFVLDWIESILVWQIELQYFVQYDIGFPFSTGDCKQINDPGGNNGHNASLQIMFIVEKQPQ